MEIPFLDIHTHNPTSRKKTTAGIADDDLTKEIYNIDFKELDHYEDFKLENPGEKSKIISAGLHPWDIKPESFEKALENLENIAAEEHVKLIGECGLDKLRGPHLDVQSEIFIRQVAIAEQFEKPVVIHCVKAHGELIALYKKHNFKTPMIIHGYNKSPELALQLTEKNFLLSFGEAALREDRNAIKSLFMLYQMGYPFFLETDGSMIPIQDIYHKIANLLKIDTDTLKDVIFASWKKIGL